MVKLKPSGISTKPESTPSFSSIRKRYDPKRQMLYVRVSPNSFREFGMLRSALSELGFRYDVIFEDEQFKSELLINENWVVGKPSAQ